MKWPWSRNSSDNAYSPPTDRAHRGFVYLDDDIVINSLSALESGKVDEVVEKINLAQERGLSVGIKANADVVGANAGANANSTESLQAEVIRRRTRFSIFELWYGSLKSRKAVGRFSKWGNDALIGVEPGQVIELRGAVELVPIQTGFRMFLWFVDQVRQGNTLFKDAKLADLKQSESVVKFMLGERDEISATLTPLGDEGPTVGVTFLKQWLIESIGHWNGVYTLVAQVEEVLEADQTWPTMRIIEDAPLTALERKTLTGAVEPFRDALQNLGVELDENSTELHGPALILRPIALYR